MHPFATFDFIESGLGPGKDIVIFAVPIGIVRKCGFKHTDYLRGSGDNRSAWSKALGARNRFYAPVRLTTTEADTVYYRVRDSAVRRLAAKRIPRPARKRL